jgi:hypothetical protein
VLEPKKYFQSSVIFAGKARILPLMGPTQACFEFMQTLSLSKELGTDKHSSLFNQKHYC